MNHEDQELATALVNRIDLYKNTEDRLVYADYLEERGNIEIATLLRKEFNHEIKSLIAGNRNTPIELLSRLIKDDDPQVRWAVLRNPSTPPKLLIKFAGDEYWDMRMGVAGNLNAPIEALSRLAGDRDPEVRHVVAWNSNTPPELLIRLTGDEEPEVREMAVAKAKERGVKLAESHINKIAMLITEDPDIINESVEEFLNRNLDEKLATKASKFINRLLAIIKETRKIKTNQIGKSWIARLIVNDPTVIEQYESWRKIIKFMINNHELLPGLITINQFDRVMKLVDDYS